MAKNNPPSVRELANQYKQRDQGHFTLTETTTSTTTTVTQLSESRRESKKSPSPTPPPSTIPSSSQPQVSLDAMRLGGSILHNLNNLKKSHANVHILFQTVDDHSNSHPSGEQAFSQTTLLNPEQASTKNLNVKLPFDPWNTKIKAERKSGKQIQVKKWDIIQDELAKLKSIISSGDCGGKLRNAVINYNKKKAGNVPFNLLNHPEISHKFTSLFEFITEEVVKMQTNFPQGIPLLRRNSSGTIFMNQKQISSILANAFLCTFPSDGGKDANQQEELAEINFYELFNGYPEAGIKIQKLKCILHYFTRIKELIGGGNIISFERRALRPDWEPGWWDSSNKLSPLEIVNNGCIEDEKNCLQVDFANQFVGGGVLGRGMVMEEIRFCICPELIAARLFTAKLEANEVLIVTGCEQFSKYSGYGSSFKHEGNFRDDTGLDELGRRKTKIVAMDAYDFSDEPRKQYEPRMLKRELNKSYAAFLGGMMEEDRMPIATGNWGCGVFNGDPQLKFLLQWMSASQTGRRMHYYTVGNYQWGRDLDIMAKFLHEKNVTVGKLWAALHVYYDNQIKPGYKHPKPLFYFLANSHFLWK